MVGQKDYDMCFHTFLTLDKERAERTLKELNQKWMDEHNPTGYTMTDKNGNNTGPYNIEEIELDVIGEY
jgi:hypothetical protein